MDTREVLRHHTGWSVVRPSELELAKTEIPLDEEYWLALRFPAEVQNAGNEALSRRSPSFSELDATQKEQTWREFRAYIRQAEGFYRGACVLPWKSSPLNYYYSFMNLAKALAVSRGFFRPIPSHSRRFVGHGLQAMIEPGSPDRWTVSVKNPNAIFSLLYQAIVGVPISNGIRLDARTLLGYVRPIAWQLDKTKSSARRLSVGCHWIMVVNGPEYWDVICIPRDVDINRLPGSITDAYAEVNGAKDFLREVLDIDASVAPWVRVLERKVPFRAENDRYDKRLIVTSLKALIPNCVFEYLDGSDFHFSLALPYETGEEQVAMTELLACYAIMYFLSSAVRYHPDYLDQIAESSDAWIVESFVKGSPITMLRNIVPEILGYTLVIERA